MQLSFADVCDGDIPTTRREMKLLFSGRSAHLTAEATALSVDRLASSFPPYFQYLPSHETEETLSVQLSLNDGLEWLNSDPPVQTTYKKNELCDFVFDSFDYQSR